ncbi:hypothetical protein BLOT_004864, partial [Blomia tropicalis]
KPLNEYKIKQWNGEELQYIVNTCNTSTWLIRIDCNAIITHDTSRMPFSFLICKRTNDNQMTTICICKSQRNTPSSSIINCAIDLVVHDGREEKVGVNRKKMQTVFIDVSI